MPAASVAAHALAVERRPDLVVVSGDLTQRAKPRQFREARAFVDGFDAPTLVVPGNHDVPLYRLWERVFAPLGAYRRWFAPDLEPTFHDDELVVVGLNTAHAWTFKDGRITGRQRRRLRTLLDAAPPGACRVVVAHHQLVPAPGSEERTVLRHAKRAIETLAASGADLVLSGHLHQAFSERLPSPQGIGPLVVHSGTSTSNRGRGPERGQMTANWVVLREESIEVTRMRWDRSAGGFVDTSRAEHPRRAPGAGGPRA